MSFDLTKLLRSHIAGMKPYSSARDEYKGTRGVFLDANENPYGSVGGGHYNRYPDPMQWEVKEQIAKVKGVTKEQIFLGNGSDEPIDLLIRAFCEPHRDNIIQMSPTYGMYQVSSDLNGVEVIDVPLTADFHIKTEEVLKAVTPDTKIIFICSPNNPTGNSLKRVDIERIVKSFEGLVVIDEAYIDFSSEPSFLTQLASYPNLIVLQTFSKAWGLAGVRLGMAFASEAIIKVLSKIKYPYNINILSQQVALKALSDLSGRDQMVKDILEQRAVLAKELLRIPYVKHIYPSDANFLLVKMDKANEVFDYLISKEIILRSRTKIILCEGCLRVSVGTKADNDALIAEMKNF